MNLSDLDSEASRRRGWAGLFALFFLSLTVCAPPATIDRSPSSSTTDPLAARGLRHSPADDWITIRDFRFVTSTAVSNAVAYFGTTEGLERLDTLGDRWLPPVTVTDGIPSGQITALAVSPAGDDVWIGTSRGMVRLLAYAGEVEPVWGPPPTRVSRIVVDATNGSVYARVGGSWWEGRNGSPVLDRIDGPPSTSRRAWPRAAAELDPGAVPWTDPTRVFSPMVPSELFRITFVDRDQRGDFYAGTWGDNARRWGAGVQDWEPLYFGLAGPGGPIVRGETGYWFLPSATRIPQASGGRVVAAAHVGHDLQRWRYAVPVRTDPGLPSVSSYAAAGVGDTVYLGTDYGLIRGIGNRWKRWDERDGPSMGRVVSLTVDEARLWIGTQDGLFGWDRSGQSITDRFLRGRTITAVAAAPDALFVGTRSGLFVGRREPGGRPPTVSRAASRGWGIVALALHGTRVLVASDVGLEIFDRVSGEWRQVLVGEGQLRSAPLSLAVDESQAWIGTAEGLVRWRFETGEWRTYDSADGLAEGPVTHLLAEPDAVWASTPAGVSRFAWREADR
jgi:hypothetical protein